MKEPGKCPAPGLLVFNLSIGDMEYNTNCCFLAMKKYLKLRKYTFKNIHDLLKSLMDLLICNVVRVLTYKRLHHEYATHSTVSKPRVKCLGVDPRYANAPPSELATLGNAPRLPGGGGGWALPELTNA